MSLLLCMPRSNAALMEQRLMSREHLNPTHLSRTHGLDEATLSSLSAPSGAKTRWRYETSYVVILWTISGCQPL
ncbi:hypothetical protein KC343_g62 [Hortaea werneckii]|nr:hypothetical protein KC317_g60 [Hortaea werneckii]KAI7628677.1 hypothetical protein KC346_g64 [Hortaea werneckii]KAI7638476.1 hypothetical protein KC343_g62 [Hortaea werneckii]